MARPALPRILVLSAYYFPFQGGAETHARALARYLSTEGFGVIIVTKRADRDAARFETLDGVPVHRVPPAGPRTGLRKWAMIPFAILRILQLKRDFDLIYCPSYQGIGIAGIVSAALLRRPLVLRSANLGVLTGRQWDRPLARWRIPADSAVVRWLKRRLQRFYMRADDFACNCREIEDEALESGVPRARVHYLPNAVDIDRYRVATSGERTRIRSEEGWPEDVLICLYVGRLSVEKGVMDLLEAWRAVRHPRKLLVLVGPDMPGHAMDVGPAARQYASAHGMGDEVTFYGESADVPRLLRGADVYVQPSHYEAFSNSLIEAMATGLPVVASNAGGMRECVTDGENGLLSEPGSPADIARQIGRLLDDPALRARFAERARATVIEQFSEPVVFRRFAALFREAATPGSRGASAPASGVPTA